MRRAGIDAADLLRLRTAVESGSSYVDGLLAPQLPEELMAVMRTIEPKQLDYLVRIPSSGVDMSDFARILDLTPGAATAAADRLVATGLVERRRRDTGDRRRTVLVPRQCVDTLVSAYLAWRSRAVRAGLRDLSPNRRSAIRRLSDAWEQATPAGEGPLTRPASSGEPG